MSEYLKLKVRVNMKILSVDSSAVTATVSILDKRKVVGLFSTNSGLTHSRTLLPMVDAVLKNSETELSDIDCFACSVGPGSFTGVRIGVATIKGLADGLEKKCIAVSTLKALAYNLLGGNAVACCVMDARRNQVYTACFDINGDAVTRLTEDEAIEIDELGKRLAAYDKKVVFVGDGAELCHKALGYYIAPPSVRYQNAASVALCALDDFDESKLLSPKELMPKYLRLPQAERELRAGKLKIKD